MEPEYSKDEWQEHLLESWIIVAIVALILLLLVWRPFHHEEPDRTSPAVNGVYNNLSIQEILERRQSEGAGRLFPPRGFGGLLPHQAPAEPAAPAVETAPAAGDGTATDGTTTTAPSN